MTPEARPLSALGLAAPGDPPVRGLTADSRRVGPGFLFAALAGSAGHGAAHAQAAVAAGAAAILTDAAGAARIEADVPVVVADDPRAALARAAAAWFGRQPDCVVAVTGTNGKTSVASFTRQIWEALGLPAVSIGTVGVEGAFAARTAHTTPEPVELHRLLAEIAGAGVGHCAMEASSHGLSQRRLDGVRLAAAAFTNISQDHLDYHEDLDAYLAAKAGLFDRVLPEGGCAVVDVDGTHGADVIRIARARGQEVIAVGTAGGADLRVLAARPDEGGQSLRLSWRGEVRQVRVPLVGAFQASNVVAAAALAIGSGSAPEAVLDALPHLRTVRGRMDLAARTAAGGTLYVDYAHTPDAVASALRSLRPHVMGRIVAVLGAGGDRDRAKRPLMGAAAAEHADVVIVTDDNPRSEDPAAIRAAVMAGAPGAVEIGDRAEAILRGAAMLEPGDALLIAGKGHETGQEVAGTMHPFDDAEQASIAAAALDRRA